MAWCEKGGRGESKVRHEAPREQPSRIGVYCIRPSWHPCSRACRPVRAIGCHCGTAGCCACPQAQVAQVLHHDILQPCPARAPRRVPRLPRGRLARLQLILIRPTVCSLRSCSASQADTAGRQPRRAARRTRPGTRRRRPSRSLPGAPISRLSSQCASTVCEYPRLLSLLPAPLSLGSCPVRGSCGGKKSDSAQAPAAPVSSTSLALIELPI